MESRSERTSKADQAIDDVRTLAARTIRSLERTQVFAEVSRIGYETAGVELHAGPTKRSHEHIRRYMHEQGDDFYDLFQTITLRCWSVLEAFVEDACEIAIKYLEWGKLPHEFSMVKCNAAELLKAIEANSLHSYLLTLLSEAVRAPMRTGANRFESLLKAVGLDGKIEPCVKDALFIMSQYRHCIVHNDGIIDAKLSEAIPAFCSRHGWRLGVTYKEARTFLYSCFWYVIEVQARFSPLVGMPVPKEQLEKQASLAALVREPGSEATSLPFARPNLEFAKSIPWGSRVVVLGPAFKGTAEGSEPQPPST